MAVKGLARSEITAADVWDVLRAAVDTTPSAVACTDEPDERTMVADAVAALLSTEEMCATAMLFLRATGWTVDKARDVYRRKRWEV